MAYSIIQFLSYTKLSIIKSALHQIKCFISIIEYVCWKYAHGLVMFRQLFIVKLQSMYILLYILFKPDEIYLYRKHHTESNGNGKAFHRTICIIRLCMRLTYHDLLKQISFSTSISWQLKHLLLILKVQTKYSCRL